MASKNSQQVIANTISFVKNELKGAEGGHDWFHIERVYKNSILIALFWIVWEIIEKGIR